MQSSNEDSSEGVVVALGLVAYGLAGFARDHDAYIFTHWDVTEWQAIFPAIAADSRNRFVWSLAEVDVDEGLHRAVLTEESGKQYAGPTDWELLFFCRDKGLRDRARFFREGVEVSDPFAGIGLCSHE